jgi:hypothetical protein
MKPGLLYETQSVVEVFKTNVSDINSADGIKELLQSTFSNCHVHFDLEDCDNILRFEGNPCYIEGIISIVSNLGHQIEVLEG